MWTQNITSVKVYWHESRTKNDFRDATLACDGKQIRAHKFIISLWPFGFHSSTTFACKQCD